MSVPQVICMNLLQRDKFVYRGIHFYKLLYEIAPT
jgi:hypothetical protein